MTSDELYNIIVEMQNEKENEKKHPTFVTRIELIHIFGLEDISNALYELIRDERLSIGDTCNSTYYEPIVVNNQ